MPPIVPRSCFGCNSISLDGLGYKTNKKPAFTRAFGLLWMWSNPQMVPRAGLEPARYHYRGILSPMRLPISPPGQEALHLEAWAGIEPAYAALQADA